MSLPKRSRSRRFFPKRSSLRRNLELDNHLLDGLWSLLATFILVVFLFPSMAHSQAIRIARPTPIRPGPRLLCVGCTLTVSASPASVNFNLVRGGIALGSNTITITTNMTAVASVAGTLNVFAYFSSSVTALSGTYSSNSLPSSVIFGRDTNGIPTAFTAFTQANPVGSTAAGLQLYTVSSLLGLLMPFTHTDNLSLEIDLTSLPNQAPDTYTGTLIVQAQQF